VIDALRRFATSFLQGRRVSAGGRATLEVLLGCRTAARGGFRYECESCGYSAILYGSCGNRYCSQCQGPRRHRWAEAKQRLLLPVPHHQVVVTLPAELRPLARRFPREIYGLLFDASQEMLQKLAATRWNASLAILSVLHTWTRELSYHPHVHCVVSAGGLTEDGGWVWRDGTFLFPVRVMSQLFRGIFLSRLTTLGLPLQRHERVALRNARRRAARKNWVVHVEPAVGRDPQHLVKYLARYVYQNAISDHRILAVDDDTVTLRTRGSSTVTLKGDEFVRRFVLHILPKRFRRVRQYGLLAPGARRRLTQARELIEHAPRPPAAPPPPPPPPAAPPEPSEPPPPVHFTSSRRCPVCSEPLRVYALPQVPPAPLARGPP
jgi:hypothetical protein